MGTAWNKRSVATSSPQSSQSPTFNRLGALAIPLIKVQPGRYRIALENLSWVGYPELQVRLPLLDARVAPSSFILWEGQPRRDGHAWEVTFSGEILHGELALLLRCAPEAPSAILLSARLSIEPLTAEDA